MLFTEQDSKDFGPALFVIGGKRSWNNKNQAARLVLSPGTKLAGLDLSHEMVRRSRERLPEADITEGDAEEMPFEDGAFDAVSCHMSIHHHPHPEKSLAEMYRILGNKGTVVINELTGPKWLRRFMNWCFTKWPTGDESYLLSPLLFDLTGFPPIDIFYGTREVMIAYLKDFRKACTKCGVRLNVHIGKGMMHCWGAMEFVPEAKAVRQEYFQALQ